MALSDDEGLQAPDDKLMELYSLPYAQEWILTMCRQQGIPMLFGVDQRVKDMLAELYKRGGFIGQAHDQPHKDLVAKTLLEGKHISGVRLVKPPQAAN